ncbi:hypothetical protein D3C79_255930 [compost metagenome]|jgi:hypothetical protein
MTAVKKAPLFNKEDVLGLECKHAIYTEHQLNDTDDLLTVKELVWLKDGTRVPRLRFYPNRKRPFGITKEKYRNHKDKKEVEDLDKLILCETTQRDLNNQIVRRMGYGNPKQQLRTLCRNQYIYGADIAPATLLKRQYQEKWPGLFHANQVAVLDTETDMWNGDGKDIIISTVTFKNKAIVTILDTWIEGIPDAINQIREALNTHLGHIVKPRGIEFEIKIMKSPGAMVKECVDKCHDWMPDFVSFWNMDFDMTVMIRALENEGYNLAEVFSAPEVPKEYKYFKYKRGPDQKVKADGKSENLAWYDRWHTVTTPSSHFWIDSAAVYRNIRRAKGKEPSYALDKILKKNLGEDFGKLYFPTGDSSAHPGSVEWHMQMQKHFKIPYVVYNVYDCLGVELLDEKVTDLNTQIGILSGSSEYSIFNSNPKRNVNDFYFDMLKDGMMTGTLSDRMEDELDRLLLGKEDWIVTLPTSLVEANGVYMIKDLPSVRSFVRRYTSDADIGSTYPNGEIIMNLSKMTTMYEVCRIAGVTASKQRLVGINLTGGPVNSIEIMTDVMKAPDPFELLEAFEEELRQAA